MPTKTKNWYPLDSPADLLELIDEGISSNRVALYPWQIQIHNKIAQEPPKGETNKIDVVAANDSGKSKLILAPALLWHTCQFDKSSTVLTSGSALQLDKQTARYIKDYARRTNQKFSDPTLWTIQHRGLKFRPTEGCLDLFATDEATKAEGWHQMDYDSALMIAVDESKGVEDEIFAAIDRCHDAQRILFTSSPAIGTSGYFYRNTTLSDCFLVDHTSRRDLLLNNWHTVFKITAYECPHIPKGKIDKLIELYGLYSPIIRSMIFAEFSSVDESVVIRYDQLTKLFKLKPLVNQTGHPIRVGGDLAAGGDEDVLSFWQGNKQLGLECFRERDTTVTKHKIVSLLVKYGVKKDSEHIFMDDGNVGHSIIDMLRQDGWNVKRVCNQSRAMNPVYFLNRGAELWFSFARFVENEEIILLDDRQQTNQLSNRYYKDSGSSGKHQLESKRDAKAKGHPSPDRADATVLAFCGLTSPMFNILSKEEDKVDPIKKGVITQTELVEFMDRLAYGVFESNNTNVKQSAYGCMNVIINNETNDGGDRRRMTIKEQLEILRQN